MSRDAVGILGVIRCFVVIIGTAVMLIASAQLRNVCCFFMISTELPKRLLDRHIFGQHITGHTMSV